MPKDSSSRHERVLRYGPAALAVGLPLLAYLLTVYPGIGDRQGTGDAIEYQLVGRILSIPHEPGYPQYVLLSHLWSYLPLPISLATKINLLSAVFTTIAGLFFFSSARALSKDDFAAILATWMILLTPSVWLLSTQAEVYSLNLMWVSAVIWAASRWSQTRRHGLLVALFFFYALSFGNHLTMITLLPALVFLILATDSKVVRRWQNWVWAILAIGVGLSQYGLLLWRSYNPHPALLPRFPRAAGLAELGEYVTGSRFVDRHLLETGFAGWLAGVWEATLFSIAQLTLPFALLCLVGLVVGLRQRRRNSLFLLLAAGCVTAFAAAYGIKDSLLYMLPAWLCCGLFGALGLAWVLARSGRWRRQLGAALTLATLALVAWRGASMRVTDNPTDLARVIEAAEPGTGILAAFKPRRARLLRLYYHYGEVNDKAVGMDFHAVNDVLATGLEEAADQPLYFRDPRTARVLSKALIETREIATAPPDPTIWTTAIEEPLTSLELRPLWDGNLALTWRGNSMDLLGDDRLHLFLVSGRHRRLKGYVPLDTASNREWANQLTDALEVALPGDHFLLVVPMLDQETRRDLETVLRSQSLEFEPHPGTQRHAIAWWTVGGLPEETQLESDLTQVLILRIEPAAVDSG